MRSLYVCSNVNILMCLIDDAHVNRDFFVQSGNFSVGSCKNSAMSLFLLVRSLHPAGCASNLPECYGGVS